MGDCGSNLLGLLLGCIAVEGAVKTQAVLALLFPLVVLAVPFLDTTFVVLKRMKYRRPIYRADANHFHHRLEPDRLQPAPDGALPLRLDDPARRLRGRPALRPLLRPPRQLRHRLDAGDGRRSACSCSRPRVYLVYVLEILKFKRLDTVRLRRMGATEAEIDEDVERRLETGEFEQVRRETEEFDAVRE